MIDREELAIIGKFRKPHGTKGEITVSFNEGIAGQARNDTVGNVIAGLTRNPILKDVMADLIRHPLIDECPFLICEIDGIFVPFHIKNCRYVSDTTAYIQLKNINSDQQARRLVHKEVFFPKKYISENTGNDSFTWDQFIGFSIIDELHGKIGRIVDVDTTTINTLFVIENDVEEILIPAVEEFIIRIDEVQEELYVVLPEGLVG